MHLNGPLWTPSVYFKALFGDVPVWEPQKKAMNAHSKYTSEVVVREEVLRGHYVIWGRVYIRN